MTWIDGLAERARASLRPEIYDYIADGARDRASLR